MLRRSRFAPVKAFCNLRRKKSRKAAAATSGPISVVALLFASSKWKVKRRSTNPITACVCEKYRGKVNELGREKSLQRFPSDRHSVLRLLSGILPNCCIANPLLNTRLLLKHKATYVQNSESDLCLRLDFVCVCVCALV